MPANRWLMTGIWLLSLVLVAGSAGGQAPARPNFLWISIEDASPDLGCYGDPYSVTPNLDRFAAEGVRFTHAFSNSPVCAPSRSTLITGVYCTTMGTHQMRCQGIPAAGVRCFPEYLREAGYYCTNNVKTDYQFAPPLSAWDESSPRAHWRKRKPGQPFFAVFNFTTTHESQVRLNSPDMHRRLATLRPGERHDPTKAVLPPYYPDTPAVRLDWARYYDLITLVDRQVEEVLRELEADGLKENTIVWFWGDHGRGLSRAKRWVYDSGTRVPLLIRVPEPLRERAAPNRPELCRPGAVRDDLVSFVDFAPTMLALAAIPRPRHMQGRPFLGARDMQGSRYVFAHRDRMDEAYDLIRSVRDQRFRYIRNFRPDLPYSQRIAYMDEMPTM
ncbi:MAG: sulfatase, partial [SAR202 cluster bacterium]|nr:sulfatase [SAR202 cluster bacterium]